jgi:hypothetical protein
MGRLPNKRLRPLLRRACLPAVLAFPFAAPAPAGEVPVLLRVPRAEQHDTLGCNFVTEVTTFVYRLIQEDKVRLWDSRLKDIPITGATLMELERSSRTDFTAPEVMYLYENWDKSGGQIVTQTLGILFLNKNPAGEEVSYGYVDYNDLKSGFIQHKVGGNPNAGYNTSLAYLLYKKHFYFNIVQFGGQTLTTGAESRTVRDEFVGRAEFNPAVRLPVVEERAIEYVVEPLKNPQDDLSKAGNALVEAVEDYLQENEEVFFNLGGDRVLDYLNRKKKIRVNRLVVTETWKKKDGLISSETESIIIFTGDSALAPVRFGDFILWGVFVDDRSMYEVFREKKFTFFITRINAAGIPRKDAYIYYKALLNADWRRLTEYVKAF